MQLGTEKLPLAVLMCVTSLLYNVFYFAATAILPLAHVNAGFSVAAMLLLAILTKFWLRKDLGYGHGFSLLFASLGVALINQPWSSFGCGFLPEFMVTHRNISASFHYFENQSLSNNSIMDHLSAGETDITTYSFLINVTVATGYVLITLVGFAEAINLLVVGVYLGSLSPFFQGFIVSVVNIPASFLISMYMEELKLVTNAWDILLLSIHCLCTTSGLICSNGAAQRIKPSHICLIQSFAVVIFLGLQYTLLDTGLSGRKNALEIIGVIIITASIVLSTLTSIPKTQHEDL